MASSSAGAAASDESTAELHPSHAADDAQQSLLGPEEQAQSPAQRAANSDDGVVPAESMRYLYLSRTLAAWGDRVWEYAAPIIFTFIFTETLLPAALFALIGQLMCVVGGSYVGNWVDRTARITVVRVSLVLQNTCVAVCGLSLLLMYSSYRGSTPPWSDWTFAPTLLAMSAVGGVAALCSIASDVAVTKDWAVVLANGNSQRLSEMNAIMRRINLGCKVVAPVAVSGLLALLDARVAIAIIALWNVVSLGPEYLLLVVIYRRFPKLSREKQLKPGKPNPFRVLLSGWHSYIRQPVLLASLSLVLLYITVLCPGALMNAYLNLLGVGTMAVGAFQAVGAVFGLAATWIAPPLIARLGLSKAGLVSVYGQVLSLLVGVVFYALASSASAGFVYAFMAMVIVSRVGLYAFDLCEVQLMQHYVPESERGVVGGVEYSLANAASLIMFALGTLFSTPAEFGVLVFVSFGCVSLACALFTVWHLTKSRLPPPAPATTPDQADGTDVCDVEMGETTGVGGPGVQGSNGQ